MKAFASFETLRKDAYAKTWLVRIVINECYAIMRRQQRLVPIDDFTVAEAAAEQADYSELYDVLSRLPEEIRLAVTLYYIEGYSVREIAALMDTTESAVKNRLARARSGTRRCPGGRRATGKCGIMTCTAASGTTIISRT